MKELLELLKSTGLDLGKGVLRVLSSFIMAMFFVYLGGRSLNVLKSDRSRNIIALLIIIINSVIVSYLYFNIRNYYETLIIIAISYIVYVLLGFKLYDRMDSFLDKTIGEDKPEKKK